jgi:hypothetical protein
MGEQKEDRLFLGSKKIIWYNSNDDGDVDFTLDDGSNDTVTAEQFKAIAKPSRYDDGMVRVYKWNSAISQIMEILLKNKMKLIEKDFVIGRIDSTIIESYQKAAAALFGAKYEEFINLAQIDAVLKEHNMLKYKDESTIEAGSDTTVVEESASDGEEVVSDSEQPAV